MIQQAIKTIMEGNNVAYDDMVQVMDEMMSGTATQAQMGALLAALRMKGETIDEITACATVMREKGLKVKSEKPAFEIVGTGGDEVGTFNISTTASFILAAAGLTVAKHGNRSVSSKSGAADVLEHLGAELKLTPEQNEKLLNEIGQCFLFAQVYHSAMRFVAPVRKEIGIRTIFNILGPLTNPAAASMQLMGVYNKSLVTPLAQVLSNLGVTDGMTVYGDGLDEISLTGENTVCEIRDGVLSTYTLKPEDFGLPTYELKDIVGGTPEENAEITKNILNGTLKGAKRDIVAANAAASLYIAKKAATLKEGVALAEEMIDNGKAYAQLEKFIAATKQF